MNPFNLKAIDYEGQPIPCNGESNFDPSRQLLTLWYAMAFADFELQGSRDFLRNLMLTFPETEPFTTYEPIDFHTIQRNMDDKQGDIWNYPLRRSFVTLEEKYTLFKLCRWAAGAATTDNKEPRHLIQNLINELSLVRNLNCLAISSSVEAKIDPRARIHSEAELGVILALSLRCLTLDDNVIDDVERQAVRRALIILGVQSGKLPNPKPFMTAPVPELIQQLSPNAQEVALVLMLEMVILDHKVSHRERDFIGQAIRAMNLFDAEIERICRRVELDTGATIRMDPSRTIDYSIL